MATVLPLAAKSQPVVVTQAANAKLAEFLGGIEVRVADNPTEQEISAALKTVRAHPGATVIVTLAGANGARRQLDLARTLAGSASIVLVALHVGACRDAFAFRGTLLHALVRGVDRARDPFGLLGHGLTP